MNLSRAHFIPVLELGAMDRKTSNFRLNWGLVRKKEIISM